MVEGGDDVETVARPEVSGLVRIGIVMDENLAAEWAEWGGILAMGTVEVFPSGDVWIERGWAEEAEGHLVLDKEDIPKFF